MPQNKKKRITEIRDLGYISIESTNWDKNSSFNSFFLGCLKAQQTLFKIFFILSRKAIRT